MNMVLTPEDQQIIYQAVRDGAFAGNFWGAIIFHIFLFGGIILLGTYANKKYGETIKKYLNMFGLK